MRGVPNTNRSLDTCKSGILVLEITKSRDLETSQDTCGLRVPPVQPWEKTCSVCPTKADVCSLACASTPFNDSKSTIPRRSSVHAILQIRDPGRFLKALIFRLKSCTAKSLGRLTDWRQPRLTSPVRHGSASP